jgi:Zn-dependent protease with chaperone function
MEKMWLIILPPLTWQESTLASEPDHHATLPAHYFDGVHAQARQVQLRLHAGQLIITEVGTGQTVASHPSRAVQWPEKTRHGARIAHLPDGGSVQAHAPQDWDRWRAQSGHSSSWVEQAQLSWRAVVLAMGLLITAIAATYLWGLPLLAQGVLMVTPRTVDQYIGETALPTIEESWFQPSELPPATQERLLAAFTHAAQQARIRGAVPQDAPAFKVLFRRSRMGPNALALPDGSIIITDELVTLMKHDEAVLTGVFAHEWGHVQHRHGMRMLIQASAVGALASAILGDFSQMLAAAPVMLGHMAYSRDFEREADEASITLLQANRIPPSVMVALFEGLNSYRQSQGGEGESTLGMALSSHPSDAERIERFRQANDRGKANP